jgi:hypothetical protein
MTCPNVDPIEGERFDVSPFEQEVADALLSGVTPLSDAYEPLHQVVPLLAPRVAAAIEATKQEYRKLLQPPVDRTGIREVLLGKGFEQVALAALRGNP